MMSLKLINEKAEAHIIALCETKLAENAQGLAEEIFSKKHYKTFHKHTKAGKGGLLMAVKHNIFQSTLEVTQSDLKTIMAIRLSNGNSNNVRIILGYAPQETDDESERERFFDQLALEVKMCLEAGDVPLLVGDFNAKIAPSGSSPQGQPTSKNGHLLHEVLTEHDLRIENFDDKCIGKWTHVIRTTGASSVLDYIITNSGLQIKEMTIDETTMYCPFNVSKKKGITTTTLSDHNSILVKFDVPRLNKSKEDHSPRWIFKAEGYSEMESIFNQERTQLVSATDTQQMYDEFENIIDSTLDRCFMKTKKQPASDSFSKRVHHTYKDFCRKLLKFASRGKIQRKVAAQYRDRILQMNTVKIAEMNNLKLLERVADLSENDRFSAQKFWKMKKTLQGRQSTCHSVFDSTGREVFEPEKIVETYKNEFDNRLSSVIIKPPLQQFKDRTDQLCEEIIRTTSNAREPDFSCKELGDVVKKLKKGKAYGPDRKPAEVYMNGGDHLMLLTLQILNSIKHSHVTPEQWEMMLITPLFKGKGTKKDLNNQRGIFLTQVISKIWERLIKERTQFATKRINKLQAGNTTNKSTADQVFLLRSCVTHAIYLNAPLYLNFYDFRQCFDKLWLEDSIIALYKLGLHTEMLALIYETNRRARIVVNTPLGKTDEFLKTSIVKQGSVTACGLCSASTGEFCDEHQDGGMPIGQTTVRSIAYVDDLTTANSSVSDANTSHANVCFFSDKKKSPLNEKKSYLLPVNCKKTDPIPIQLVNGKQVQTKDNVKCLGDIFNSKGTYSDLVDDRVRRGTVCTVNSIALCNDSQMGKYSLTSLILLYKTVLLPTVLYNSETWNNMSKNDYTRLSRVQNKYLKWMLHTPKGTCTSFTLLELGLLPAREEIDIRKLSFLHHILNLPPDDPVYCVYNEQKLYTCEPNWYNETQDLLRKYGLVTDESTIRLKSKVEWKAMVKQAVRSSALVWLNADCRSKSKTADVPIYETLEQQEYLKSLLPSRARMYFQIRAKVFDIKEYRSYQYTDATCRLCQIEEETMDHVLNHCTEVSRNTLIGDIYDTSDTNTSAILQRAEEFRCKVSRTPTSQD